MSNPDKLPARREDLQRIIDDLKEFVYDKCDGYSMVEVIGLLELAKLELLREQEERIYG